MIFFKKKYLFICLIFFSKYILISCDNEKLFTLENSLTGFIFENKLQYTEDFNPYTYRNFYNGGGVALGDINNDGLIDIYLTVYIVDNIENGMLVLNNLLSYKVCDEKKKLDLKTTLEALPEVSIIYPE